MHLSAELQASGANFVDFGATQLHPLGSRGSDRQGRVYRYAKAGALLVPGNVVQSPAIVTAHLANTPPVVPIGAESFVYTPGAALGAENQYADGFLQVDTTPGNGQMMGISGHKAFASGTAFTLNLAKDDTPRVALTTGSRVGLISNPYRGVIQVPITTATGLVVGVAVSAIPSGEFGWILTWGLAAVLIAGTPALGAMVMAPGAVAGAAEIMTTTNLVVAQIVGNMAQVGVTGKNNAVFVKISP